MHRIGNAAHHSDPDHRLQRFEVCPTALRLGVFDFLLKQITPGDLDQMLRRYQENMQKKARALSCSFYFSFFDESNTRSIADCMEDLCVQVPFQKACAMTFQYNEPVVISHALVHSRRMSC